MFAELNDRTETTTRTGWNEGTKPQEETIKNNHHLQKKAEPPSHPE